MKKIARVPWIARYGLVLLVFSVLPAVTLLRAQVLPVSTGTWAPANSLSAPRAGAATVLLQDGRILVTGGSSGGGAVASVDVYDTSGNVSAAAPMNFARSQHTATVLNDSTVLVVGGIGSGGTALNSAEIYNPATNTWTPTSGSLNNARSGHTASLLQDGTVLLAGGDNAGTPQSSLEIFNEAAGTFTVAAGSLSSPRELHAAALLQSGQVIIVGGFNGVQALATSDIYNPTSGSVSAGPVMSTARQALSATTQLDGNVFVAGGNSGSQGGNQDLSSCEVYSTAAGSFNLTGSLTTARSGHLAFLLPNSAAILIVGGTLDGVAQASSELYYPWMSAFNSAFWATSSMASARSAASGGVFSNGTEVSQNDGLLLVAGGQDASTPPNTLQSAELYGFAWVKTDAPEYAPGETVNITGGGWVPGENVTLSFQENPYYDTPGPFIAVADSNGNISNSQFSPDQYDVNVAFTLTASGSASQAQTTFADSLAGTFSLTGSMTTARDFHTATLLPNGEVLVAGGYSGTSVLASAELYNPTTGLFTATGSMNSAREYQTATLLANGLVLVAGGYNGSSYLASAELYNPTTGTFTPTGSMNTARQFATATLLANGEVLVAGGYNGSYLASAELYNPTAGTFTLTGSMNNAREYHTATLLAGGEVLVAGGQNSSGVLGAEELYNPATGKFTNTGSIPGAREYHTATLLPDGEVLITGGQNNVPEIEALSELYDPTTGNAADTGSMNTGRAFHTAALLSDGLVLVAGGATNPKQTGFTATAELYNATPGTFTLTGSMNSKRAYQTATLLPDGQVLVAGGYNGSIVLATAELYNPTAGTTVAITGNGTVQDNQGPVIDCAETSGTQSGTCSTTYSGGTTVTMTATPAQGYTFGGWTTTGSPTCVPSGNTCSFTILSGGAFNTITATFTTQAATVTLSNLKQTYTGSPLSPMVTTVPSGLSYSLSGAPDTNAGSYSVTATVTSPGYTGSASGTFTINPVPLIITASSGSMTYGGSPFVVGPLYSGFVNGQGPNSLTTQPACLPVFSSSTAAGTYPSSCSGAVDSNYSISYATGSVTVAQAATTTAVASSVNPSTFKQLVTFTATVAYASTGSTGTPTGTVTFYNNGSSIGTGTLSVAPCPCQATFMTSSLPDSGGDSITAVYGGDGNFTGSNNTTSPLAQTVNPAPLASLSPLSVSFGNQNVNTTSNPTNVTLTNIGDAPLNISAGGISINPGSDTQFVQKNNCGSALAAGASCTITLTFTPVDTGVQTASLQITDNDDDVTNAVDYVSLTGAGLSTIDGGSLYSDAIFATANGCGSITLSGSSIVDSFNSVQGYASSHVLSGGNVGTNGNVTLNGSKSAIYGSAAADSLANGNCSKSSVTGLTTSGGAQVTGGLMALNGPISYPAPAAPNPAPPTTNQNISGSCPAGMSGCTNAGNKTVTLAPGQYGNVQLSGGTTANFSQGTYNFNSLTLSGNSVLYVTSGPVVVNLAGASLSGGNPAMDVSGGSIQNPSGIPANLQFTYAGSQGINLSGGSGSYATVYAPHALVNMSGGSDFFGSIIGSTITNSGGTAIHYDTSLPNIQAGNYIWFNAVVNNVSGLPKSGQVKLYLTDSTINFTANGQPYSIPVPNAVVTFNSAAGTLTTTYSTSSSRWSTSVPAGSVTGNTFVTGVPFQVPAGGFPGGIQNVTWSAAFTTDSPGTTLQWQWGAAVYNSFSTTYGNLGVNPEDGSADPDGTDPAGTPESYKGSVIFGATGGGATNYTGYFSSPAGVVPTIAPMSVSPSSLSFAAQTQGTTSPAQTAILTNNDVVSHTITSITISGANASDFTPTNNCPLSPNTLAAGASCTITVAFTPGDVGSRSAKVSVNDDANNNPQTLYLSGTGQ